MSLLNAEILLESCLCLASFYMSQILFSGKAGYNKKQMQIH